jgi:hypothetical protein
MKRKFTADEVRELVWENEVETIQGEDRRWSRTNCTIIQTEDGKYYELYWEQGLTECQENEFEAQEVEEVELKEETKTVTQKNWVKKENKVIEEKIINNGDKEKMRDKLKKLANYLQEVNELKDQLKIKKEEYEASIKSLKDSVSEKDTLIKGLKGEISPLILEKFDKDPTVKKFDGGLSIKEYTKLVYDKKEGLDWAKENASIMVVLDVKAFEKYAKDNDLSFVKKEKESKVEFPTKGIKLEEGE